MPSSGRPVFFADCIFNVCENVYEPAEDSFFFAEHLSVREGDMVLDVGAGCGILGILAAKEGADVVAVDINPFAVRCANENAALNHVSARLSIVRGDLLAPIDSVERFDAVFFNAPYVPTEDSEGGSWLEQAWAGGASGRVVIDRFISEAPRHLKTRGRILLMQSTLSDVEETLQRFGESGVKACVLAQRDLPFFESLVIVAAEH
jgi:release factor glutamine methyltransferase